jgi:hypothetical protein
MKFIYHTLFCLLILTVTHTTPSVLSTLLPKAFTAASDAIGGILLLAVLVHVAFIVYFYTSKKYCLFALPLSHVIFPFLHYFTMWLFFYNTSIWRIFETPLIGYAFLVGIFYFLPLFVLTLIISLIIKAKRFLGW